MTNPGHCRMAGQMTWSDTWSRQQEATHLPGLQTQQKCLGQPEHCDYNLQLIDCWSSFIMFLHYSVKCQCKQDWPYLDGWFVQTFPKMLWHFVK